MKEDMTLKEFMEESFKLSPMNALQTARDLIELEGVERKMNIMWGVELDIRIKVADKQEGRFYGKSVIEAINNDRKAH